MDSIFHRLTKSFHWVILICLFVSLFINDTVVFAQSFQPEIAKDTSSTSGIDQCYALDVVFIVDQSGSMSGTKSANYKDATDPLDQRKFAVESAIDQLTDNALDRCPNSIHRIAIISFGSSAKVDLGVSQINPETANEAEVIRTRLKQNVQAVNMDETDPLDAFELAKSLFTTDFREDTLPADNGARKRVIIFITDGEPHPDPAEPLSPYIERMEKEIDEDFPFDETLKNQEACFSTLVDRYEDLEKAPQEEINKCLSDYRVDQQQLDNSYYIFGLFLKSTSNYQTIADTWQRIVSSHQGKMVMLSNNRQDLNSDIRTILSSLIGTKLNVVSCGKFAVNPYLKRAILTFFKNDPKTSVTISYQDASGQIHTVTDGNVGENGGFDIAEHNTDLSGLNERYVINAPYPGIWEITANAGGCENLDAYYDPVVIDPTPYQPNLPAEIPEFTVEPYYDKYHPNYLEYQIKDIDGAILSQADDPRLAINITVKVAGPNGTISYTMAWDAADKLFRTTEPIQVPEEGTYTISMAGTYYDHAGPVSVTSTNYTDIFTEQKTLFDQEGITFKVHGVTPFTINVDQPKADCSLGAVHETIFSGWPLKIHPITVSVSLLDQNGSPLKPETVLTDPDSPFEVTVISGKQSTSPITLTKDPTKPNTYTGQITNSEFTGKQNIQVKLVSKYNEYYRPQDEVIPVSVTRQDGLLTTPGFYYVLLGLLILYVIYRIAKYFYKKNHRLVGFILAKQNGAVMRVLNLATGTNTAVFGSSFWQRDPARSLGIRSLLIKNIQSPKESSVTDPNGVPTDDTYDDAKVHFSYRMESGAKGNGELSAGMDQGIGDPESLSSLEYAPSLVESIQYVQSSEDSGQKPNILSTLFFVLAVLAILALVIVMFIL
jgi:hypothetical protein